MEAWTIRTILQWTVPYLKDRGSESARLDAELLLCEVLDFQRIHLYTEHDRPLTTDERHQFRDLVRRRGLGEPVAYILGRKEFLGYSFKVGPEVLIPRPETELLVEEALAFLAADQQRQTSLRALDIGTGSGCIGLSLALAHPEIEVECWDVSAEALQLAQENARTLGVDKRVSFVHADALSEATWQAALDRPPFDLLLSNPPYIGKDEVGEVQSQVLGFEPQLALFAADEGLAFYKAMAKWAPSCLKAGARAFWEVGHRQGKVVEEILRAEGWASVTSRKDYSQIDRIVAGSWGHT